MASICMANSETIHIKSYSYLNESLGIEDYEAFMYEPTVKAKIDRLVNIEGRKKEDIAKSLAVFSAFTEGVSLFSSFAILISFSKRNLLKGVGQIIAFSVKDESLHSDFGCYLFRTFMSENPEIFNDELKKEIYQAARDTYQLESDFIDNVFSYGDIEGINPTDLKNFIKHRINVKLGDIGFKANYTDIDQDSLKRMEWFDYMTIGVAHDDFFASRVTDYAKGTISSEAWDDI
jgi:ribonucleoside-diphosphate reductase beta chain